MLETARSTLADIADLRLCDASRPPFPDGSFDLVTAFLTLQEMPPAVRESVTGEMVRVTCPDGCLVTNHVHPGPSRIPMGWLFKLMISSSSPAQGGSTFEARGILSGATGSTA